MSGRIYNAFHVWESVGTITCQATRHSAQSTVSDQTSSAYGDDARLDSVNKSNEGLWKWQIAKVTMYAVYPLMRSTYTMYQPSNVYRNHSPTARKLSHRTDSSLSPISSITRVFKPSFSSCVRRCGSSLTS